MSKAISQYLQRYAEPEWQLGQLLPGVFSQAVALPACGEGLELWDALETLKKAAEGKENPLLILTLNAPENGEEDWHFKNKKTLEMLPGILDEVEVLAEGLLVGKLENLSVVVIDRASEGRRMPEKEGVGLARKIGSDFALGLFHSGKLRDPWLLHCDGDSLVPNNFFDWQKPGTNRKVSACILPFRHVAPIHEETKADMDSLALYECSLRYYRLGLSWAGSPHARHTLGSTIITYLPAYAQVRGFPKRKAAEDFHLLDKLFGVGEIVSLSDPLMLLQGRPSTRVPFGTGRAMMDYSERKKRQEVQLFYHPKVFGELKKLLESLVFSPSRVSELSDFSSKLPDWLLKELPPLMSRWDKELKNEKDKMSRVQQWLGGLRTLKLIHHFRDTAWPNLPWDEALSAAGFLNQPKENCLASWSETLLDQDLKELN